MTLNAQQLVEAMLDGWSKTNWTTKAYYRNANNQSLPSFPPPKKSCFSCALGAMALGLNVPVSHLSVHLCKLDKGSDLIIAMNDTALIRPPPSPASRSTSSHEYQTHGCTRRLYREA